jgi:hypothetical protein
MGRLFRKPAAQLFRFPAARARAVYLFARAAARRPPGIPKIQVTGKGETCNVEILLECSCLR